MSQRTLNSRIEASFLCLAVTDALGGPLEFGPRRHDPSHHVTDMLPNDNFALPPGHFTDDTSMALCLAFSLLESKGRTDKLSQARAYVSWYRDGWMSSVPNKCFDIGVQTTGTLHVWEPALQRINTGDVDVDDEVNATQTLIRQKFSEERRCGNGSLMRVLPCALVATTEQQAIELARDSSDVTHPHSRCTDACTIYTILVYRALHGASKEQLLEALRDFMVGGGSSHVDSTLRESFRSYTSIDAFTQKPESQINSSGYVLHSLDAALWAFFATNTYKDGAIKVVNLGDDADTVGAIYGGLAGAFYGHPEIIPKQWMDSMKAINILNGMIARILHRFHREAA